MSKEISYMKKKPKSMSDQGTDRKLSEEEDESQGMFKGRSPVKAVANNVVDLTRNSNPYRSSLTHQDGDVFESIMALGDIEVTSNGKSI